MYQTLKQRSGISEFILESVCRDFLEKHGRFPYLDEIPGSNSESYLKDRLKVTEHGGAKITNILEVAGKGTVEEAIVSINNQFRDLETTIVPINKEALVDIVHRPTDDNFDNWSEEDEILARAPRDDSGNLLAPNGKISNLTEKQYVQVRTEAFKKWFGDWINVNKFNINAIDKSKVDIEEVNKPWKSDSTRINKTLRIYLKNQHEKGYFELVKDEEFGIYSVHFKTGDANTGETYGSTREERAILYKQLLNALPNGAQLSTWGELSEGGIKALNKLGKNLTKVGEREVKDRKGNKIIIPIYQKGESVSKVVDENGEPLVVYHGSKSILNVFDPSKSESRQYLSQQIKPTNFFSSDKTVADFFALTENQSLASQISKSISIVLDAFAGENIDEDIISNEIWAEAARRTGKSKEFVKDFWENKVPKEYKMYDDFGTTRMEDPDINKYKYNVFLNMKSPIILDAKGERADRFIEANKEVLNNNDEVIIININETVGKKDIATDYLVRNPNQIKSATDNSGSFNRLSGNIYDIEPNDYLVLNNTLQKLAKLYGINFNTVTDAELNSERWADLMPESRLVNAFIYDGQIYINVDRAKLDAPIHEMLHIFVGSMRFTNPKLYQELIQLSEKFPNYDKLASQFSGKTRNDINEEVFITEVSKHLTGQKSSLTGIDEKLLYEISYNVHRVLDSVLMGTESSKTITDDRLYTLSLKDLAFELNSAIMTNNMPPLRDSELHRTLNNMKSDLMKEGKLEEICD